MDLLRNREKWFDLLSDEDVCLGKALIEKAADERAAGRVIFPEQDKILRAIELTPPEAVKVVIVGQDPYFNAGQANGLAFSVNPGVKLPPSLKNIFKELSSDIGCPEAVSGDLTAWAEQGVLLLNTVLTVYEGSPNSHSKWGWQKFVRSIFEACLRLPQPVVFLLWGGQARGFMSDLQADVVGNKVCFCSSHPSPLGARKASADVPAFMGSRPFSSTNEWLIENGVEPIDWSLD